MLLITSNSFVVGHNIALLTKRFCRRKSHLFLLIIAAKKTRFLISKQISLMIKYLHIEFRPQIEIIKIINNNTPLKRMSGVQLAGKRVMVTGATGFVGSRLT